MNTSPVETLSTREPLKASLSEVRNPNLAQIRGAITVFASLNENLQSRVLNHMETERIYARCSELGRAAAGMIEAHRLGLPI